MRAFRSWRGFTLLELVLVVAILATLAGLAIATYSGEDGGVEGQARAGLAQSELATVQRALVRFHQDTGFLPGTGPFRLDAGGAAYADGRVPLASLPAFVTSDHAEWLEHPANLWPLVENPLRDPDGPGGQPLPHPLGRWDPVTRRGWNGPYLSLDSSVLCLVPRVPAAWTAPGQDGRSPWAAPTPPLALLPAPVVAITDPFEGRPHDDPAYAAATLPQGTFHAFACFTRGLAPLDRHGMPFVVFDRTETPTDAAGTLRARVVSLGADRTYGGAFTDPRFAVPPTDLAVASDPSSDDLARFVHR